MHPNYAEAKDNRLKLFNNNRLLSKKKVHDEAGVSLRIFEANTLAYHVMY
jgi:hypothetical protein